MQIKDHHIPEGTIIGINGWVVHFDKNVFGEDAGLFRPERWADDGSERLKRMEKSFFAVSIVLSYCGEKRNAC